jgi:hypothetical protein
VVLRLRVRVCFEERCIEGLGIASTGFAGKEPEIVMPQELVKELIGGNPSVILVKRVLADGSKVFLPRFVHLLDVYLITEDRVEGPIKTHVYITRGRFMLLNDALLSKLRIVILDPFEGVWCFRDEINKKERRGA